MIRGTVQTSRTSFPDPTRSLKAAFCQLGIVFRARRCDYNETSFHALQEQIDLPEILKGAVVQRRVEFLAGRLCARDALSGLGLVSRAPLGIGPRGMPHWPPGHVGSISHADGVAIAGVARRPPAESFGLDIERTFTAEIVGEVRDQVAATAELRLGAALAIDPATWLALLFSIKESVYKAVYPITLRELEFRDIEVRNYDPLTGVVDAHMRPLWIAKYLLSFSVMVFADSDDRWVASACLIGQQT